MKRNIQYIFLFLLVVFYGCESYYEPVIDVYPNALVVAGMLTDQNDYAKIQLTRSVSFNKGSYFLGERKAKVSIESESGLSYPTSEIGIGLYQTNDKLQTKIGEGYYLKILTSDGEEYHSDIEKMLPPTPIDSIYLTDSTFNDLTYSYWGDPVVKDYAGITFSVVPREPAIEGVGFLYKWNALVNYYVYAVKGMSSLSYYCWKQMFSNTIYVYDYVHDNYINELPLGDLHSLTLERLSPLPIDSSRFIYPISTTYSTSFYYHLQQYTISKEGSKFWRSVKNQSEASGKLFDPVEQQIFGNIHCISDSSIVAFGFFNVASFCDKMIWVELTNDGHKGVKKVDIMPTVKSDEDCFMNEKPDFWY
jgi:hypothetical protein